jgi:hypothetical protein
LKNAGGNVGAKIKASIECVGDAFRAIGDGLLSEIAALANGQFTLPFVSWILPTAQLGIQASSDITADFNLQVSSDIAKDIECSFPGGFGECLGAVLGKKLEGEDDESNEGSGSFAFSVCFGFNYSIMHTDIHSRLAAGHWRSMLLGDSLSKSRPSLQSKCTSFDTDHGGKSLTSLRTFPVTASVGSGQGAYIDVIHLQAHSNLSPQVQLQTPILDVEDPNICVTVALGPSLSVSLSSSNFDKLEPLSMSAKLDLPRVGPFCLQQVSSKPFESWNFFSRNADISAF